MAPRNCGHSSPATPDGASARTRTNAGKRKNIDGSSLAESTLGSGRESLPFSRPGTNVSLHRRHDLADSAAIQAQVSGNRGQGVTQVTGLGDLCIPRGPCHDTGKESLESGTDLALPARHLLARTPTPVVEERDERRVPQHRVGRRFHPYRALVSDEPAVAADRGGEVVAAQLRPQHGRLEEPRRHLQACRCAVAAPWPVLHLVDDAGPHRVQHDVPAHRPQVVVVLHDLGAEATLEQMPDVAVASIPPLRIGAIELLDRH